MTAGSNIVTIRRRWGMSQQEFGALLGVSRNTVVNWEVGRSEVGFPVLYYLADLTGLSTETIQADTLDPDRIPATPATSLHKKDIVHLHDRVDRLEELLTEIAKELRFLRGVKD